MIVKIIFSLLSLIILTLLSYDDYKTYKVETNQVILLWLFTTMYAIIDFKGIISLLSLLYLVMIFTVTLFISFGIGDYLTLTALWPFLYPLNEMWFFLIIFMSLWAIATTIIIMKRDNNISIRTLIMKKKIPLIPIITLSFVVYIVVWLGEYMFI